MTINSGAETSDLASEQGADFDAKREAYEVARTELFDLIDLPDKAVPLHEYREKLSAAKAAHDAAHKAMMAAWEAPVVGLPDEAVEAAAEAMAPVVKKLEATILASAALKAAAPHMLIHVHHHDIEHHARSFNEGYEAAVTQGLADDPTLADDWFQEKIREAKQEAWHGGYIAGLHNMEFNGIPIPNPYRSAGAGE